MLLFGLPACLDVPSSACLAASQPKARYLGLEFLGSSQVSQLEIEKYLGLKTGSYVTNPVKNIEKLNNELVKRNLEANIELVPQGDDSFILAVDIIDHNSGLPTRRLRFPRHVQVTTEKPFQILEELRIRQDKLEEGGRPVNSTYQQGVKTFEDEPMNQLCQQMLKYVPGMQNEIIEVIHSDPDPKRRLNAIGLLNWSGNFPQALTELLPALDDADSSVRSATARFYAARLDLLPKEFSLSDLVDSLNRQLQRPSHSDRQAALSCLNKLSKTKPKSGKFIKTLSEANIKKISKQSQVPSVRDTANQILSTLIQVDTSSDTEEEENSEVDSGI
jgi:hypothetical protein